MMRCGTLLKVKNLNVTKRGVVHSQSASFASKGNKEFSSSKKGNKELPFSTFISSNAIKGKEIKKISFANFGLFPPRDFQRFIQPLFESRRYFSNTPEKKISEVPLGARTQIEVDKDKKPETPKSEKPKAEPLDKWSQVDVERWFNKTFPEYTGKVKGINGKALLSLTIDDIAREVTSGNRLAAISILNTIRELKKPQQEVWNDPAKFHNWIQTYDWPSPLKLKETTQQLLTPHKLSKNYADFPRMGRDQSMKLAYNSMWERYKNRLNAKVKGTLPTERQDNPVIVSHSPPGGGKSTFLDEIGKRDEKDLEQLCEHEPIREILKSSVTISISYHNGTPFVEEIDKEHPQAGLALRVLYSFYFSDGGWDEFCAAFEKHMHKMSLKRALKCILYSIQQINPKKTGVLLLVDELVKSGGLEKVPQYPQNTRRILTEIGSSLDEFSSEQFNIVISTLDPEPLSIMKTPSGRKIVWILLNPLSNEDSLSLFPQQKLTKDLKLLISDCGGHPRTLENLKLVCEEMKWVLRSYLELRTLLVKKNKDGIVPVPTLELIKPALRGLEVKLGDSPNGKLTYQNYISLGYYLNTIKVDDTKVIPKMSPIFLLMYADNEPSEQISQVITKMLGEEHNFNFLSFERFHGHWEILRRLINQGSAVSIKDFYSGASFGAGDFNSSFQLSPKKFLELKHHFPTKGENHLDIDTVSPQDEKQITKKEKLLESILHPSDNNPGCDLIIPESKVIFAIECRFSKPDSTTILSKVEIQRKVDLIQEGFGPHLMLGKFYGEKGSLLGQLEYMKHQLYSVFIAFRQTADNAKKELPDNAILLERDALVKLYSPTLSSRPQFISDEKKD